MVIAVVDDLLFSSKIRAASKTAGAEITFARSRDAALAAVSAGNVDLVLVDLDGRSGDAVETIAAIRAVATPGARIVAFGAHVNVDRLNAAIAAGADESLPRSAFVNGLVQRISASIHRSTDPLEANSG